MHTRTDLKIFIASSSELNNERDECSKIIIEINKSFPHLHLEPVRFELDIPSGNNPGNERIQDTINVLLDKSDIVIVLFYSRIGEFTLEEFQRAKLADKKIFLYLKEGFQTNDTKALDSYRNVLKLREDIQRESSIRYQTFKTLAEFKGIAYPDIHKFLDANHPSPIGNIKRELLTAENKLRQFPNSRRYFTGRDKEIDDFKNAIDNKNTFITVDGPGGIGKTQFISRCIEKFVPQEKIIWFECSPVSQFDTLISEAGYPELLIGNHKTDREKFSAFKDKIQENEYYLFLDNFQETNSNPVFNEFLIFIQEYLQKGCVVVIDRDDIRSVRLTPKRIHIEGLKEKRLEYARALIDHTYREDVNIPDLELEQLCEQLQGYPLAIDFAIFLLSKGETPSDIATKIANEEDVEQISERLLNAIFSRPDATQEEKDFIRQFSVFNGSISEEVVSGFFSDNLTKAAIRKLQQKNLLSFANKKYKIHPLVKEFCYKELDNKRETHAKVADYYIKQRSKELDSGLEEQIFFHLTQSEQWERLENEIIDKGKRFILLGQLGIVQELINKLVSIGKEQPIFHILIGDIAQIKGEWDSSITHFEKASLNNTDSGVKAEGLVKYGEILYRKGRIDESLPYFLSAYRFAKNSSLPKEEARALNDIALVDYHHKKYESALTKIKEALGIQVKSNDYEGMTNSYNNIALITSEKKQYPKALEYYEESFKIADSTGNMLGIALNLSNVSEVLRKQGKLDEAYIKASAGLKINLEIGDKAHSATCLNNLGAIFLEQGDHEQAIVHFQQGLKIREEIGDKHAMATSLRFIGVVYHNSKDYHSALVNFFKSLSLFRQIGDRKDEKKTIIAVNSLFNTVEKEKFKTEAIKAYDNLDTETQKYLDPKEFFKEPILRLEPKVGRNDPCICGSGKKYKNCHGL